MKPYTKEELISLNPVYHREYGVSNSDVDKINRMIVQIEKQTQSEILNPGCIIVCKGPKRIYNRGHFEGYSKWAGEMSLSICTEPYGPFVYLDCNLPQFNTSGGYWISVKIQDRDQIKPLNKKAKRTFWTWGHCGPCGNGGINFEAEVNCWELYRENIY